MYLLLALFLVGVGLTLLVRSQNRILKSLGACLVGLVPLAIIAMEFWASLLWFDALGYESRFWTVVLAQMGLAGSALLISLSLTGYLIRGTETNIRWMALGGVALVSIAWSLSSWRQMLLFFFGEQTTNTDPFLGLSIGFYLFSLPFMDKLFVLALIVGVAALLALLMSTRIVTTRPELQARIPLASFALALVAAYGVVLEIFHLQYSELGVVTGPGWTDIHVAYPALLCLAGVLSFAGVLPFFKSFRRYMARIASSLTVVFNPNISATVGAWALISMIWLGLVYAVPGVVQWLVVKPNEITFELPYIERNIEFTRTGFKLDKVEERQFEATAAIDQSVLDDNQHLLSEVRLWDWQALDAVYKQFQEIRLYYEFLDVDIDRYQIGDRYRQVMVAARELAKSNLPEQSQTFVNQRFKYTHGHGITMAPVSDFTGEGLPKLLIKDIPAKSVSEDLIVTRPEIYYGEMTNDPVIVNSKELEFDYPSGESNVYVRYEGSGGVVLDSFWRKFLFGWKFDGTPFLLSSYPTRESRVMFHRKIQDRVERLAPFLVFDEDPYITLVDGRLKWIVDAYTSSAYYPYSQPFESQGRVEYRNGDARVDRTSTVRRLQGMNYVRNSVKAVVDAYDGKVQLYVFDPADPIVNSWRNVFPEMFYDSGQMPQELRSHVRYPQDFLLVQGLIFARYHMTDPEVFYNQEDLWVRATEKHYHRVQPVEPYYVMWELPGSDAAEFVLMMPFTPKNRQVMIGWIAGLSDGENYGRFIAYKFPKETRVLGPQQVETKIDQDAFLSGQLTLWDQQGSEVIRGNVLAIPVDDSLLYVEPIYLRAETAAYPELRLVAVMQGDQLSYASTFEEALLDLVKRKTKSLPRKLLPATPKKLVAEANDAFESYLNALGEKDFSAASEALQSLSDKLQALEELKM